MHKDNDDLQAMHIFCLQNWQWLLGMTTTAAAAAAATIHLVVKEKMLFHIAHARERERVCVWIARFS